MILEEYGKRIIIEDSNNIKTVIIKTSISLKLFLTIFCVMILFSNLVLPVVNIIRGFDIELQNILIMIVGLFISTFLSIIVWSIFFFKYSNENKTVFCYSNLFGIRYSIKEFADICSGSLEICEEEIRFKTKYFIKLIATDFRFGNFKNK